MRHSLLSPLTMRSPKLPAVVVWGGGMLFCALTVLHTVSFSITSTVVTAPLVPSELVPFVQTTLAALAGGLLSTGYSVRAKHCDCISATLDSGNDCLRLVCEEFGRSFNIMGSAVNPVILPLEAIREIRERQILGSMERVYSLVSGDREYWLINSADEDMLLQHFRNAQAKPIPLVPRKSALVDILLFAFAQIIVTVLFISALFFALNLIP